MAGCAVRRHEPPRWAGRCVETFGAEYYCAEHCSPARSSAAQQALPGVAANWPGEPPPFLAQALSPGGEGTWISRFWSRTCGPVLPALPSPASQPPFCVSLLPSLAPVRFPQRTSWWVPPSRGHPSILLPSSRVATLSSTSLWDPSSPVTGSHHYSPGDPDGFQPPSPHSCQGFNSFPVAAMSNNMAKIAEARKTVEQLKLEVNIDRIKVSQAAAELLAFCETHAKDDPLVTPVPAAENPFRDKRLFCTLL
ncbi:guanine nucleotide binding protein (G protein) gamma 8 [Cricetulus griseus]